MRQYVYKLVYKLMWKHVSDDGQSAAHMRLSMILWVGGLGYGI